MRTITFLFIVFLTPVWGQTHAILDSLYTQIEVKAIDKMLVTDFKRLKILDEQGYSHSIYRDYHNSFRKVKSFRYTIYDAGGNRVKRFGLNDAMDVMFNAPYEVTDSRMLILDPSYRRFPFFVEIETVTQYDEFLDMPEWIPRYEHNMAVRFAALSLRCPSDYEFRMQSHHLANPTVSSEGRIDRYLWTLRDLAASPPSSSQRLFTASQPRVIISPYKFKMGGIAGGYSSWSEFGDWYLALNSGPQTLSERTKMDLKEIRAASDGDHELVRQVYQYMQQKTRYVSIQLGIGGYKALSVAWVDEMGYGDCKALTNYMHALLAEVGISSNQVLVKAGEDAEDVVADVPSNQFNHIFLAVPHANDTTWLECTSQLAPASYVGTFTDDRTALWLAPGKSRVIRTPSFSASKSTRKTESVILLDAQGNAKYIHTLHVLP